MRIVVDVTLGGNTYPFVVDTGATDSVMPRTALPALEIAPWNYVSVRIADGTIVKWPRGFVEIRTGGRSSVVPMVFGDDSHTFLLGMSALNALLLCVDTQTHRLVDSGCVYACPTIVDGRWE